MQSEAIQKLITGRELATRLSTLIQDSSMEEGLLGEIISSITQALDLLESNGSAAIKRKNSVCGRGGSRKRSQASPLSTVMSESTCDEYSWRKYGQKVIHGSKYPRSYFRCTHKYDKGCQATKQVQQHSDDTSLYMITYLGQHSCKSSTNIIPNLIIPSSSTEPSMVSFGTNASNVTPETVSVPSCSFLSQNQENDEEVLSNLHEEAPGFLSSTSSLDASFLGNLFDFENDMFAFDDGSTFYGIEDAAMGE